MGGRRRPTTTIAAADGRQQDDPARVREPVAAERELAGDEAVLGEHGGEARERGERVLAARNSSSAVNSWNR